jgi:hypothetical protein
MTNTEPKTCGTCKYLGDLVPDEDEHRIPTGYHVCQLIKRPSNDYNEPRGESALVIDASGYFAALCVKDEFGCNQWEGRTL